MSSTFGSHLKIAIFGQSHAPAIGVTIDGLPAGMPVDLAELQAFLARRAPGGRAYATPRKEPDAPEILCGVVDGRTCGAPLTAIIRNTNTRSGDYAELRDKPRPSHADYVAEVKYGGFQDVAGGGQVSGRLPAPLCIAGGLCMQFLARQGVTVAAHIASIGAAADRAFDPLGVPPETVAALRAADFPVLDAAAGERMQAAIAAARAEADSVGGVVECIAQGLPVGLGDPMFGGLENRIAQAVFAIPAVKGLEFGAGFASARLRGSENNDAFCMDGGTVRTRTNRAGGILGGISSGMPVLLRAAFKPTPSIGRAQQTVSLAGRCDAELTVHGRHDPCIVPRAVPCVEAAVALALTDVWLDDGHAFAL